MNIDKVLKAGMDAIDLEFGAEDQINSQNMFFDLLGECGIDVEELDLHQATIPEMVQIGLKALFDLR